METDGDGSDAWSTQSVSPESSNPFLDNGSSTSLNLEVENALPEKGIDESKLDDCCVDHASLPPSPSVTTKGFLDFHL